MRRTQLRGIHSERRRFLVLVVRATDVVRHLVSEPSNVGVG